MNKHQETLNALEALADIMEQAENSGSQFNVKIYSNLLRNAIESINAYKYISDEFAKSITITQGKDKPKIAVDIERFLAAQWTYNQEIDELQQRI